MARTCELYGIKAQYGNNVSHSERKTRRRFLPNLHKVSLLSDTLKKKIRLKVATSSLRTVDAHGGLDNFLLTTAKSKLAPRARKLKTQIEELNSATQQ
jgi:large subunit ribosomal protein L28